MLHPLFEALTESLTEELFLREFSKKYHYEEPQLPTLAAVAVSMQKAVLSDVKEGKAGWSCGVLSLDGSEAVDRYLPVCITLGSGIDALQESYLQQGLLLEAYMVETLASELLLQAYPRWNDWVAEQGAAQIEAQEAQRALHVRRYHFLGSEGECPIESLPELLKELKVSVTCTSAYCMLPKKSVAFYAELTEEQDVHCEGICVGCGSRSCPNRMDRDATGHVTDMTDRRKYDSFIYG